MEGFSVKKRAIGRPDTLRASFEQGHADCVVKERQVGDGLSRISDAGKSCSRASSVGLSRI
jgi:hypothetical protein